MDSVPDDALPLFVATVADDDVVPPANSLNMFSRWRAAGHSAELHTCAQAGHGFGMLSRGLPGDYLIERFYAWLNAQGIGVPADDTAVQP